MHDKYINVANFFWVGELTQYELLSFNSFLNNGFDVNIWTYFSKWNKEYNKLLDEKINLKDASEIIDESYLMKFTQGTQKSNMSSFSNLFRFELLKKEYGWWFDSDCICLKNVEDFKKLNTNKQFVLGLEYENYVGSSVAYISDNKIADLFLDETYRKLKSNEFNFYWGEIGPDLITETLLKKELINHVYSDEFFFKIPAENFYLLFDNREKIRSEVTNLLECSFVSHTWNEMFRKFLIDKNKLPPKGSFLYDQMEIHNVQLENTKIYKPFLRIRFLPVFSLITKIISRLILIVKNKT